MAILRRTSGLFVWMGTSRDEVGFDVAGWTSKHRANMLGSLPRPTETGLVPRKKRAARAGFLALAAQKGVERLLRFWSWIAKIHGHYRRARRWKNIQEPWSMPKAFQKPTGKWHWTPLFV